MRFFAMILLAFFMAMPIEVKAGFQHEWDSPSYSSRKTVKVVRVKKQRVAKVRRDRSFGVGQTYIDSPQKVAAAVGHTAGNLVSAMGRYLGGNPTGWARRWCGQFMGMVAKQLGYATPKGHALAANWRHAGQPAHGPAPGVVMVMPHHVGVVVKVLGNGKVLLRSGNYNRRVADGVYDVRRAIAWRVLS